MQKFHQNIDQIILLQRQQNALQHWTQKFIFLKLKI